MEGETVTISMQWLIAFASAYLFLLIAIRFDWMRRNGYDPHSVRITISGRTTRHSECSGR